MTYKLRDALADALPKVGEPEDVWCSVHASTLRSALAALAQPAAHNKCEWPTCKCALEPKNCAAQPAASGGAPPYAYEVPDKDGAHLAFAAWFHKYGHELPDGAIPLFLAAHPPVAPKPAT